MTVDFRRRLLASTLLVGAAAFATPAFAQQTPESDEPVLSDQPEEATDDTSGESIMVTGTRIARPNLTSNSPIAVVSGEQTVEQGDITLDTYLNTLPQVNPAGTTTSNNPGNNGQSNIDLRGLGQNRNLILVDGRRPMPSSGAQNVDLNTIPQGLIERVEVVTGGAGAAYGADAIAGVVNFILRDDFEGIEVGASYSQSLPEMDSRDYRLFGTIGASLADGRGNIAFSAEYADREGLIKAQRGFAAQATSTTPTPPTGRLRSKASQPVSAGHDRCLVRDLRRRVGQAGGGEPDPLQPDGTLFAGGTFNTPLNVREFPVRSAGPRRCRRQPELLPGFLFVQFRRHQPSGPAAGAQVGLHPRPLRHHRAGPDLHAGRLHGICRLDGSGADAGRRDDRTTDNVAGDQRPIVLRPRLWSRRADAVHVRHRPAHSGDQSVHSCRSSRPCSRPNRR